MDCPRTSTISIARTIVINPRGSIQRIFRGPAGRGRATPSATLNRHPASQKNRPDHAHHQRPNGTEPGQLHHHSDQNEEKCAHQEGKLGVKIENPLVSARHRARKLKQCRDKSPGVSPGRLESASPKPSTASSPLPPRLLGARIQQQDHGKRQNLPELLLGKIRQQSRPAESDQERYAPAKSPPARKTRSGNPRPPSRSAHGSRIKNPTVSTPRISPSVDSSSRMILTAFSDFHCCSTGRTIVLLVHPTTAPASNPSCARDSQAARGHKADQRNVVRA